MSRPFACPKCGNRLRYTVSATLEYSLNPKTGEIGTRVLQVYEGAWGGPGAICTKCAAKFDVSVTGGVVDAILDD